MIYEKIELSWYEEYLLKERITNTFTIIILFIGLVIAFCIIKKYANDYNKVKKKNKQKEITDAELNKVIQGLSVDELQSLAYEKFVEIQNAKMNFQYDQLRNLCTEALYHMYVTALDILKRKNKKVVIGGFECFSNKLVDIDDNGELFTFKFLVEIKYYDYVIKDDKDYTRNVNHGGIVHKYIWEFVKAKQVDDKVIYPSCGAEVDVVSSGECKYCGSIIVIKANDFLLSKVTELYN